MCACLTERAGHPRCQSTHAPAPLQNQVCMKAVLTTPSRALRHVQTARARLHRIKLLSTGLLAAHVQMLCKHATLPLWL
jgi:truncated hemoglobin YjbI